MDKPHAIRLADALDQLYKTPPSVTDAAIELRRLHQSEQEGWRWAREREAEVKRLKERLFVMQNAAIELAKQERQSTVSCICGDPTALGVVHRQNAPCFYYLAPPKREWHNLTDDAAIKIVRQLGWGQSDFDVSEILEVARAIEAKLKELNT